MSLLASATVPPAIHGRTEDVALRFVEGFPISVRQCAYQHVLREIFGFNVVARLTPKVLHQRRAHLRYEAKIVWSFIRRR